MGGRGAGKTRAGAEWVRGLAARRHRADRAGRRNDHRGDRRDGRGAERPHGGDAARTSGRSCRGATLHWPNGVEATILGAADPERFRGPQFAAAWSDEIGKWPNAEAAWDMLQFGLRLGEQPRQLATTTPRPTKLLKRLLADRDDRRDADDDGREPQASGAELSERRGGALSRHGARAAGARRRADRGSAGRAVDARHVPALGRRRAAAAMVVAVDPPATSNAQCRWLRHRRGRARRARASWCCAI